jgi:hypothetical protein
VNDDREGLNHKLAVRVARLLKKNFRDRKEVFKSIKYFYKLRSRLVHGGSTKDFSEIEKVEGYLRDSIKAFLRKRNKNLSNIENDHDLIIDQLDLI